nr:NAD-dependent epimerase/dehydratase family protein [uncultured Niameybacter sp.]
MKILVLGGTRFFGKQLVKILIEKGYDITIGTRGQTLDDFGDKVKRLILERIDRESLELNLADKSFDIIYDNICYAPNDAKNLLEIMDGRVGRYIVTSSLAVYEQGSMLKEEAFNPYDYPIQYGDREDFSYGEGKRLIEAVTYQTFNVPTVAVRFPIVIGENDYTRRLAFYVEKILRQEPFIAKDYECPMSFITEQEAGQFLALLAEQNITGPINAATNGIINVKRIIEMIEELVGKKAILVNEGKEIGSYSTYGNTTLDTNKALALNMKFEKIEEVFERVIKYDIARFNQ